MRPKLKDISRPKIYQSPAAAAAAASVTAAYALSKTEKLDFATKSNPKGAEKNLSEHDVRVEIEAIREEKTLLELSLIEVRAENSKLTGEIEEIDATHAELSKVWLLWKFICEDEYLAVGCKHFHLLNHFLSGAPFSAGTTGIWEIKML